MLLPPPAAHKLTVIPNAPAEGSKDRFLTYVRNDESVIQGFSLVELSIVLVILGLLVGGVLTGQSLIRAAELRSVTTEFQKYQAAVNTFRDKYFALPGDMTNATAFWGAAHATPATCITTVGTGTQTCNGNGDSQVTSADGGTTFGEIFRFWQHLANAGLMEGNYTGVAGAGGSVNEIPATNVPRSKLNNAGWSAIYAGTAATSGGAIAYAVDYGNRLLIAAPSTGANIVNPILKPEEAWNIDTKIDDGKPARGNVIALYWNNLCAAADDGTHANNDLVASYKLTDSSIQCALLFTKAF